MWQLTNNSVHESVTAVHVNNEVYICVCVCQT